MSMTDEDLKALAAAAEKAIAMSDELAESTLSVFQDPRFERSMLADNEFYKLAKPVAIQSLITDLAASRAETARLRAKLECLATHDDIGWDDNYPEEDARLDQFESGFAKTNTRLTEYLALSRWVSTFARAALTHGQGGK